MIKIVINVEEKTRKSVVAIANEPFTFAEIGLALACLEDAKDILKQKRKIVPVVEDTFKFGKKKDK